MRFFVPPAGIRDKTAIILDRDVLHQLTRVLRSRPGDHVVLLDNSGREFTVELTSISPKAIEGSVIDVKTNANEPTSIVTLYQALPKKLSLFELVLQKCTEIGVSRFVPIITERTEREHLGKIDRLHTIIREAAEQSERGRLPTLSEPMQFKTAIEHDNSELRLISHSRLQKNQSVNLPHPMPKTVSIYIGPEGGFTEDEITFSISKNLTPLSLGPRILRTETAAIVAAGKILI
ncbi:MAG: RsmE family RNA methyltransferase [Patescibacteria group bacterium]